MSLRYLIGLALLFPLEAPAQEPPPLAAERWTPETLNIPDPVALSFDNRGRAYVTRTRRRKAQDLAIRQHREWIPDDLSFRTVEDRRAFYHRVLSPSTSEANKIHVADFNGDGSHDWRDLTVLSDEILLVEDRDGDGLADTRTIFAGDFRTEVTGIAAGVLWHEGAVYATIDPDLWRLEDTDGDGKADHRESIAHGFGVHIAIAGHDMHGLVVGPDGRIYWSIGDKALDVTSREGRRFAYPNQGAILRCDPDGSHFEVFARGLRNLQEFAFDATGNIFGIEHDSDQPDELDRFVYIVEGSDSGWRCNFQYRGEEYSPWLDEKLWIPWFEGQAAHITPPLENYHHAPAGFAFNPGTALAPEYRDHFFVAQFPAGTINAFRVRPRGASFEMTGDREVVSGFKPIGLGFAPGGALYAVDWAGGFALNETGAIWRIDVAKEHRDPARDATRDLLASDFREKKATALLALLAHPDQRVRLRAQFELAKDPARTGPLFETAADTSAPLAQRIHALWALGQQYRADAAGADIDLVALLADPDPEIRTHVARVLGDSRSDPPVKADLRPLLADDSPRVRLHAAIALGKISDPDPDPATTAALVAMLAQARPSQTYLRHAGVMGLLGTAAPADLATLAENESPRVRLAALLALRRLRHESATLFLVDDDEHIAVDAARAIHDDFSIPVALPALAATLENPPSLSEAFLRRALNANLLLGDRTSADRLARYASNEDAPEPLRLEALLALAAWTAPPSLDRVTGRHREFKNRDPAHPPAALEPHLAALLASPLPAIQIATLQLAARLGIELPEAPLERIVRDPGAPSDNRSAALLYLHARGSKSVRELALNAPRLKGRDQELLLTAVEILAEIDRPVALSRIQRYLGGSHPPESKQDYFAILAGVRHADADLLIAEWLRRLTRNRPPVPAELHLDILEAARARAGEVSLLQDQLARYDALLADTGDLLAPYQVALAGGNPARGKILFRSHLAAQCVRCHRDARRSGSDVGPNLSRIGKDRTPEQLLESLVLPAKTITPGYGMIGLTKKNGETISGNFVEENENRILLRTPDGAQKKIPLTEIESRTTPISLMPPMGGVLTQPELRDVLAYLSSLK